MTIPSPTKYPKFYLHPAYRMGYDLGREGKPCEIPSTAGGMVTDEHADLFYRGWLVGDAEREANRAN